MLSSASFPIRIDLCANFPNGSEERDSIPPIWQPVVMLRSGFTILLASIIIPNSLVSAQNSSTQQPGCDKNVLPDFFDTTLGKQGEVCGFPLPVNLNFTQCCAANQPIYYKDACTQYCLAYENQTEGFTSCVGHIAHSQNLTLGISGCQARDAMSIARPMWEGMLMGMGAVALGLASIM